MTLTTSILLQATSYCAYSVDFHWSQRTKKRYWTLTAAVCEECDLSEDGAGDRRQESDGRGVGVCVCVERVGGRLPGECD